MASYAKQADDETLRKHADRIQARAVRRAQELLKEFPEGGGRPKKNLDGDDEVLTRRTAAKGAGMSDRQYRTAMDVGYVPEAAVYLQVEKSCSELGSSQ